MTLEIYPYKPTSPQAQRFGAELRDRLGMMSRNKLRLNLSPDFVRTTSQISVSSSEPKAPRLQRLGHLLRCMLDSACNLIVNDSSRRTVVDSVVNGVKEEKVKAKEREERRRMEETGEAQCDEIGRICDFVGSLDLDETKATSRRDLISRAAWAFGRAYSKPLQPIGQLLDHGTTIIKYL